MTKTEFADSLILEMGYDDVGKKLDRRLVYIGMDKYLPAILTKYAQINGSDMLNNFVVSTIEKTGFDTAFDRFFVDIPKPMNLNGFAGVRQIGDTQNEDFAYLPTQQSFGMIASGLEVSGLGGRRAFYLIGNRAFFKNPPIPMPINVRVTRVPTIASLSETDEITCPADVMSFLCKELTVVLNEQKDTPEDVVNNSNDN